MLMMFYVKPDYTDYQDVTKKMINVRLTLKQNSRWIKLQIGINKTFTKELPLIPISLVGTGDAF